LPFGGLWYGGPDPGLRFGGQQLAKMCFGRWPGSFKPAILAMPYKWVRMQDERYSADSPKQPKLCEAGNVIDKE